MPRADDIQANNDPNNPSFLVRRPAGGDYVRAGSFPDLAAAATVLRFEEFVSDALTEALFLSQPIGYDTVQVWWGIPPESMDSWSDMCVVRSGFGHPTTPADGQVVYRYKRPEPIVIGDVPGTFFDRELPSGRWYYYTLFFKANQRWYVAGTTNSLVPVDYHHRDHLLGLVPPFYLARGDEVSGRWIERWFQMIGYDLDYTRTLAEGVQKIYDPDSSPQALLDAMGQNNLGFAKPSTMGDIRYRAVVAKNRDILFNRGTVKGLQTYVEAVFKSAVTVTNGLNDLLLVDDAEFHSGVGNWCPMPWRVGHLLATSTHGAAAAVDMDAFKTRGVQIDSYVRVPPQGERSVSPVYPPGPTAPWPFPSLTDDPEGPKLPARGVAKIQASNGDQLAITCGNGQQRVLVGVDSARHMKVYDEQHLDSFYRGIPVAAEQPPDPDTPNPIYYLSFWSRREPGNTDEHDLVVYGFIQYDRNPASQGFSDGFKGVDPAGDPFTSKGGFEGWQSRTSLPLLTFRRPERHGPGSDEWEHHVASFQLGDNCRFLVPFIWFRHETWDDVVTTPRYITGVMVNISQSTGSTFNSPDGFLRLTLDNPDRHIIGAPGFDLEDRTLPPDELPPYKIIGTPND